MSWKWRWKRDLATLEAEKYQFSLLFWSPSLTCSTLYQPLWLELVLFLFFIFLISLGDFFFYFTAFRTYKFSFSVCSILQRPSPKTGSLASSTLGNLSRLNTNSKLQEVSAVETWLLLTYCGRNSWSNVFRKGVWCRCLGWLSH